MSMERLLAVFQAFIDESRNDDLGTFVMAGHVATAEAWINFAKEWDILLPSAGTRASNGNFHFHMAEMASNPERMMRVPAFYFLIEKYALLSISCSFNINDLERAKARIEIPDAVWDWGFLNEPYIFAWWAILDAFHEHRTSLTSLIPITEKVDFCFDEQKANKQSILTIWDSFLKDKPEVVRGRFGTMPRFENDQDFLPLQAADLWAWWVRKWMDEGTPEKIKDADSGVWRISRTPPMPKMVINFSEEHLVRTITDILRTYVSDRPIYDRGPSVAE